MYALRNEYGEQIKFTYINVNDPTVRSDATARGYRVGTPQLMLFDDEGEALQQWFGQFTREQVEPELVGLLK